MKIRFENLIQLSGSYCSGDADNCAAALQRVIRSSFGLTCVAMHSSLLLTARNMTRKRMFARGLLPLCVALLIMSLFRSSVMGAPIGLIPTAITSGSSGANALSEFEALNLYNGQLAFALPLLRIGGRGTVGYNMTLAISKQFSTLNIPVDNCDSGMCQGNCTTGSCGFHYLKYVWEEYVSKPYLGPGALWGRRQGTYTGDQYNNPIYVASLSRFIFVLPDGSQLELRDKNTNGKPFVWQQFAAPPPAFNRGTEFVTADGTSATFVSNVAIEDLRPGSVSQPTSYCPGQNCEYMTTASGYLMMADGTRYDITEGRVTRMSDSNGNYIDFVYTMGRLTKITEPTGKEVTIAYSPTTVGYDEVTFDGFNNTPRHIRIYHGRAQDNLRADIPPTTNPTIVTSSVQMPNGKSYNLRYNTWTELARVELPTGAAVEYDTTGGIEGGLPSGLYGNTSTDIYSSQEMFIYRRLVERREYNGSTLQRITTYSKSDANGGPFPTYTTMLPYIEVNDYLASPTCNTSQTCPLRARERHFFTPGYTAAQSFAGSTLFSQFPQRQYPTWNEGREVKTQFFAADGSTLLRQVDLTWSQTHVGWWTSFGSQNQEPPNNPFVAETVTTLADTNQVKKVSAINPYSGAFGFDQYNNLTDVWEYDFGENAPGPLLRHTHSEYVNSSSYTSLPSTGGSHLRRLPTIKQVFAVDPVTGTESLVSDTEISYDEPEYLALPYNPAPPQWGSTGMAARGNPTSIKQWLNFDGSTFSTFPTGSYVTVHAKYDQCGNVVSTIDGKGYETQIAYSSLSAYAFPTSTISADPDGDGPLSTLTTSAEYDLATGLAKEITDQNGVKTSFSYDDPLNRIKQVIRASNYPDEKNQTTFDYDDDARSVTATSDLSAFNDNALRGVTLYDEFGRLRETREYETSTSYIATKKDYDSLGRGKRTYNPYRTTTDETYGWSEPTYDAQDRITRLETFDGNGASTGYVSTEYLGNRILVTDQTGRKRIAETNALGQLTDVWEITTQGDTASVLFGAQSLTGYRTGYAYDGLSNLIKVTQGQQERTFIYDSLARLVSATNPESGTIGYRYDANGNLSLKIDPRRLANNDHITVTYDYDALNRLKTRSYNDSTPSVTYDYDNAGLNSKGRLTSVSTTLSTFTYGSYDALGRPGTGAQITNGTSYSMDYSYNLAGRMTSQVYPSGRVVVTELDSAGRIAGVKNGITGAYYAGGSPTDAVNRIQYTAVGGPKAMKLGNGLWEHLNLNSLLQLTQLGLGSTSTSANVLQLDYSYHGNGNVQSQAITTPSLALAQTFQYDDLNRLKIAQENAGQTQTWNQTFTYDRFGNRESATSTLSPANPNLVIDPLTNRINPSSQGQGLIQYDEAGNLKREVSGNSYGYDGEGRLVTYNGGDATGGATYVYDGDGRRVKKITAGGTTTFVYNIAGQLVAEYTDAQSLSSGTSYLTIDALGSTRVITDSNGNVKARHDYLPFGEELSGTGNRSAQNNYVADDVRQKFTSYERDAESNLDFAQARHYNYAQGRFTRPDPLLTSASVGSPQTWNRYVYCGNDPLNYTDPSGLDWYRDITQTGIIKPIWLNEDPGVDSEYVPWTEFAYWNVVDQTWWWLNPNKFDQGPASSYMDALSRVGKLMAAETEAQNDWDNSCGNCPTFIPAFNRYTPALAQAMEIEMAVATTIISGGTSIGAVGMTTLGLRTVTTTATVTQRAAQVHAVLDPIAQEMRTTAVLETNIGKIVAGGARDLAPVQRAVLTAKEVAGKAPRVHAEVTALRTAEALGWAPRALAATRTICPACAAEIEASGGILTSLRTAIW